MAKVAPFAGKRSMTDQDRIQLHPSGLSIFDECGERWRRIYEEGERRPSNEFLIVGQAVDAAVMADLREKIATRQLLPESTMLDIARDSVREQFRCNTISRTLIDNCLVRARRFTEYAHRKLCPTIMPAAVQEPWSIRMDSMILRRSKETNLPVTGKWRMIDYVGTLDIREHTYSFSSPDATGVNIRDLKTARATPPWNAADGKHWVPMTSYAIGTWVNHRVWPELVQIDTLVDSKRGVKHVPSFGERNDCDVAALLNRIARFAQARMKGLFLPAPRGSWRCSREWCEFYDTCCYVKNKHTQDLAIPELRMYKNTRKQAVTLGESNVRRTIRKIKTNPDPDHSF